MNVVKPALRLDFGQYHYDFHDCYLEPKTADEYLIMYCTEQLFINSNRNWGMGNAWETNRKIRATKDKKLISLHIFSEDYNAS